MMTPADIHPDWTETDVALFVGVVASVQEAVKNTVELHRRTGNAPTHLIFNAVLTAVKGVVLEAGMRMGDISGTAKLYELMLRQELDQLPAQAKALSESFRIVGRA